MQNLHSQLKPLTRKAIRSAKGGSAAVESDSTSVVVATSIEEVYTQGAGSAGHRYALEFHLPVERRYRAINIQKSELMLFPNVSGSLPPTVRVELVATANFNSVVRRLNYSWETAESCAALDITQLLISVLRIPSLNGAETVLRLNVGISRPESTLLRNKSDPSSGACAGMGKRPPGSKPLIVTKYFTDKDIISRVSRQSGAEGQGCNLTTLLVNITTIFGANVIFPTSLNIGNCGGSCEKTDNEKYSYNAIAKRRLRALDPNGATLERTYDVNCVANSFEPVTFVVFDRNSFVVMEIPDLVVRSCACR
eukprot:Em0015g47a